MNAIRIRKTIDSDTIHLPELVPFVGHTVDIVIEDQTTAIAQMTTVMSGTGNWDALRLAAAALHNTYDYDAIADQDAQDLRDAEERMK